MSSTPQADFDAWFCFEHGTVKQPIISNDLECDSCIEDDYSELSGIEKPPLDCDGFFIG